MLNLSISGGLVTGLEKLIDAQLHSSERVLRDHQELFLVEFKEIEIPYKRAEVISWPPARGVQKLCRCAGRDFFTGNSKTKIISQYIRDDQMLEARISILFFVGALEFLKSFTETV